MQQPCNTNHDRVLTSQQENRRAYREVLLTAKLGASGISGVILFKETLYQKAADGRTFVSCLTEQGVYPGVKVDEGLQPLEGGLEGETVTKGLESLRQAAAEFVKAGAVFGESSSYSQPFLLPAHPPSSLTQQNGELPSRSKIPLAHQI